MGKNDSSRAVFILLFILGGIVMGWVVWRLLPAQAASETPLPPSIAAHTITPTSTFTSTITPTVAVTPTITPLSPTPTMPPTFKAKVVQPCFCYIGPNKNYSGAIPIAATTEVDLLGMAYDGGDWFMIRSEDIDPCWIEASVLEIPLTTPLEKLLPFTTVFTKENATCRNSPKGNGNSQTIIPEKVRIVAYGKSDLNATWVLVNPHNSTTQCWVARDALENFPNESLPIESVAITAQTAQVFSPTPISTRRNGGGTGGNPPATAGPGSPATNLSNTPSGNTPVQPIHPTPVPPTDTPKPPEPTATLCWPPGHCK